MFQYNLFLVAITWTNANENQYATKGKDFKIMCEVTAEPAPSVDWFKEGNPVSAFLKQ